MSNCPEYDNGVVAGTYGQSVPDVFSKPVPQKEETCQVHIYGAPVQSGFSAPVNFASPAPTAAPAPAPEPVTAPASVVNPVLLVEEPVQAPPMDTQPAAPVAVQPKSKKNAGTSPIFASKKLLMLGGIGLAVILLVVLLVSGLGGKDKSTGVIEAVAPSAIQTEPVEEVTQPVAAATEEPYGWWAGDWYGWWVLYSGDGKYEELDDQAWDVCARFTVDGETGHIQMWNSNGSADALMADVEVSFGAGLTENGAFVSERGTFMDAELAHADWLVDAGVGYVKDFDHMICIDGAYEDPNDEDSGYDYYIFLRPWGMDWEDVRSADHSENLYDDMMPMLYDSWYASQMDGAMPLSFGDTAAVATTSYAWEEFAISIAGAEHFIDYEGRDAIRIYYDFTNLSNESIAAYSLASVFVSQDDYEQVSTYASFEDDVPEFGNDSLKLRPGVTIRCIAEYSMKLTGGPITVKFYDYWAEEGELVVQFDPQNLPGRPAEWEIAPIVEPPWVVELPGEGIYDEDYYISIDAAEMVDGEDGTVVRIYYTFTNNSDETTTFWMEAYPEAYQDGVELMTAYAAEDVPEDANSHVDVAPGESIVATTIHDVRNGNPVEIEFTDYWTGESFGVMFYWE